LPEKNDENAEQTFTQIKSMKKKRFCMTCYKASEGKKNGLIDDIKAEGKKFPVGEVF
jgi:hypothetical protein